MAQTAAEQEVMESTASKFEQVDSSLHSMLSRLMNELSALQTAWQGNAARSFDQVRQTYEANQKKMSEALRETATAVRTSGSNYTATDESSSQRVAAVNNPVNLNL